MSFFRSRGFLLLRLVIVAGILVLCFWPSFKMVEKEVDGYFGWSSFFRLDSANAQMYFRICRDDAEDIGLELLGQRINSIHKVVATVPEVFPSWSRVEYQLISITDRKSDGLVDWSERDKNVLTFFYEERRENGKTFKIVRDFQMSIASIYNAKTFPGSAPCSNYTEDELRQVFVLQEDIAILNTIRGKIRASVSVGVVDDDGIMPYRGSVEAWSILSMTMPYLVTSMWLDVLFKGRLEYCQKRYAETLVGLEKDQWSQRVNLFTGLMGELAEEMMPGQHDCLAFYLNHLKPREIEGIRAINKAEIFHFSVLVVIGFWFLSLGLSKHLFLPWRIAFKEKQSSWSTSEILRFLWQAKWSWLFPQFVGSSGARNLEGYFEKLAKEAMFRQQKEFQEIKKNKKLAIEQAEREEMNMRRALREIEVVNTPKPPVVENIIWLPAENRRPPEPAIETSREKTERLKRQIKSRFPTFDRYDDLWPRLTAKNVEALDAFTETHKNNPEALAGMFATLTEHRVPSHVLASIKKVVVI